MYFLKTECGWVILALFHSTVTCTSLLGHGRPVCLCGSTDSEEKNKAITVLHWWIMQSCVSERAALLHFPLFFKKRTLPNRLNHTIIHQVQMRRIWRRKMLLIELKCDNTELRWVQSYSLDAGESICPFFVHLLLQSGLLLSGWGGSGPQAARGKATPPTAHLSNHRVRSDSPTPSRHIRSGVYSVSQSPQCEQLLKQLL